jgi:hypothetical protein
LLKRIPFAAGIISLAVLSAAPAADEPQTAPAAPADPSPSTQPSQEAVAALINQLGSPDANVRAQASKSLWAVGRPAEPALREAAASDDPEVSRRAKAVLRDFTYGLYPDAPREIFTLLDSYRKGEFQDKRLAVWGLGGKGISGLRVLMKLREEEQDPNLKQMIVQVLAPREHDVSVLMLADGQEAEVEQVLENSAAQSPVAAQDYAALLLFSGKLPQKLAAMKAQPVTAQSAPLLVALARAAGESATARSAAEAGENAELLDAVLVEQADWKTLADRLSADPRKMEPSERLGYLASYYRLAGDQKKFDDTVTQLVDHARQSPEDYLTCSENLFLNSRPAQAISILLEHKDFLHASNFLASRLQFPEALKLPKEAEEHQPAEAIKVKARTAGTLQFIGHVDEAKKMLAEVVAENQFRNDFSAWASVVEAAMQLGQPKQADEYAALALEKATAQDPLIGVFESLRIGDPSAAEQWWQFLHQQYSDQTVAKTLRQLRSIFDRTISKDELKTLVEAARRYAVDLPAAGREPWQETVADTLVAAGHEDLAAEWITRLEDPSASPAALIHAGDLQAVHKDWLAAARDYDKAWQRDRTLAAALFLRGWALTQGGNEKEGAPLMAMAHRLPLGGESGRYALYEALVHHKLMDDAARELELILHATPPRSWERNEALRRSAEDLAGKGEYLPAANMWEQAFLANLTHNVSFVEPWANLVVPALISKTRAQGLIKAGRIDAGLAEAKLAMDDTPGDADALIDLVNAMDKSGHKPEADAFYASQTGLYRKAITDYPNSGPLHNQLAWAQVMCHRELDDALKNGKRAVELEPSSTASIDTLAEVYFARGDSADAAAQMKRCIELEPRVERHRRQLARFQGSQPTTMP